MNNNLYHWQDERLVELKLREVDREIEQARLLKEAGLSGANLLSLAFAAGAEQETSRSPFGPA